MTATIESTGIGVTYEKLRESSESGVYATFLIIGNRGLKCYRTQESRDQHYRHQRNLANKGLAPFCDDCVDVTMPDGSVKYAYWTGLAEVACEKWNGDSNPQRSATSAMPIMSREAKGRELADSGAVRILPDDTGYAVGSYCINSDRTTCECADFTYRGGRCKHIEAVDHALSTDQLDWSDYADCGETAELPF